ncbi:hypothetical protein ACFE04_011632 [Oxalis oulophora]
MVGLSVVLEYSKSENSNNTSGVINKATMKHQPPPSPNSSSNFLEKCFLCKQKLLLGKDIYMYKGDRAFCSVDCRYRQILLDEEESLKKEKCSLMASGRQHHKAGSRRAAGGGGDGSSSGGGGGFAY